MDTTTDPFARNYLFVEVPGAATAGVVADLLERAAAKLSRSGELDVHHLAFETDDGLDPCVSLTVYYTRVERRRYSRTR